MAPERDRVLVEALKLMRLSRAVDKYAVGLQRQGALAPLAKRVGRTPRSSVPQYRELPALVHQGVPLELLFQM
jgi:TPP-dependent pyruvate/acetoin dehydrogenase alpha subunit